MNPWNVCPILYQATFLWASYWHIKEAVTQEGKIHCSASSATCPMQELAVSGTSIPSQSAETSHELRASLGDLNSAQLTIIWVLSFVVKSIPTDPVP